MRVLMNEKRIGAADICVAGEGHGRARPRAPGVGRNGMCRRGDREQVENHQLAIMIPPRFEKARLRLPSVRQQKRVTSKHPAEVDSAIDRLGEPEDLGIIIEALPYREDAGSEQRRVYGRYLALP